MSSYEDERKYMPKHFEYLILNIQEFPGIKRHFHVASHFIEEARRRGSVLVHCSHPQSALSVAAVLAHLMKFQHADFRKASSLVHESFPFSLPGELVEELLEYQAHIATPVNEGKVNEHLRHKWSLPTPPQPPPGPARVLKQSVEEKRTSSLQDELLSRGAMSAHLPQAVQSYWTRRSHSGFIGEQPLGHSSTYQSPSNRLGQDENSLDASIYGSPTRDLQHHQHALLEATGQVTST
jgi:hypothetical protein